MKAMLVVLLVVLTTVGVPVAIAVSASRQGPLYRSLRRHARILYATMAVIWLLSAFSHWGSDDLGDSLTFGASLAGFVAAVILAFIQRGRESLG